MKRGVIWGRTVEMQGGPLAYLVYKNEFGGDLALDLLEAYRAETVSTETFLRFAWTMAKTYDPDTSDYPTWLSEFDPDGFSLSESPVGVIDSAINAELFRVAKAGKAAKARRWLSRRLGAMARRLGA